MRTSFSRRSERPLSSTAKVFILLIPLLIITIFAALFTKIFVTLIVCLLIALVLNPAVDYLQSKGINRTISILIIYVIIGGALYGAITIFSPGVIEQAESLNKSFKEI